jgi:hypothetical protein
MTKKIIRSRLSITEYRISSTISRDETLEFKVLSPLEKHIELELEELMYHVDE